MSNKLWFGCPNCYLAFESKGEYERHSGVDRLRARINGLRLFKMQYSDSLINEL